MRFALRGSIRFLYRPLVAAWPFPRSAGQLRRRGHLGPRAGVGPLTRAELSRALGVTKRTASQTALVLIEARIATLRHTASVPVATS